MLSSNLGHQGHQHIESVRNISWPRGPPYRSRNQHRWFDWTLINLTILRLIGIPGGREGCMIVNIQIAGGFVLWHLVTVMERQCFNMVG